MNLFLVPARAENLAATTHRKVPLSILSGLVSEKEEEEIRQLAETGNGFHCWAFPQGRAWCWHSMQVGDIVLITPRQTGKFKLAGRIIYKLQSVKLGNKLWPFIANDPWKHIYLLGSLINIALNKRQFLTKECAYSPKYVVPGPNLVKDEHLLALLMRYGTLEKFWGSLTGESSSHSIVAEPSQVYSQSRISQTIEPAYLKPNYLSPLISSVENLIDDPEHKERGHESLVEKFFEVLGYKPVSEIKFRQGFVDIKIQIGNTPIAIVEVKRSWGLTRHEKKVLKQAFGYAGEHGARVVIITNGDYYALFDRTIHGLHFEDSFVGTFRLTRLTADCLVHIAWLKNMRNL